MNYALTSKQYALLVSKLVPEGECLIWTGTVHKRGYGIFLHLRVHKAYYVYNNGNVPEGTELAHSCNNKLCVKHVRPKTHAENLGEFSGKPLQTHCKRGHELTEDNVYVQPGRSSRKCRECNKIDQRIAYYRAKGFSEEEALARSNVHAKEHICRDR